ncbi:hypothetical protein Zmor_011701 [Zophobas morio]|uniref:Uncharacterized protein n=1 Tax=Zophobas morio TaxID=2755281 RepID=A0AA38IN77_9CUCU|nr:hypothetical protein Zmor_011701 [Zophobas morio]
MTDKLNDVDYYSVLNCDKSASYKELKQNYQVLIRKYHPDKCAGSPNHFITIDKAWKTLKDEKLRTQYDTYLQTQAEFDSAVVFAQLAKSDLIFNKENLMNYPCRCGSSFVIYQEYIEEEECLVECNECSNCLLIK